MMKGAADAIILLPDSVCIFAECKTETGYQSPAQKSFQERAGALGFTYFVYRSLTQFQELLKSHLQEAGLV